MKSAPMFVTLAVALLASSAAAQTATSATSSCSRVGGPSLGIGTFHCQGGECRIRGVYARIAPPRGYERIAPPGGDPARLGGSGGSPDLSSWEFTVEPSLWEINPTGPAAGRLMEGDALVAVNGSPITTREAGVQLAGMKGGEAVTLTVRRNGQLMRVQVTPSEACQPFTVSAGIADRPSFLIRDEFGRLPR